MNKKVFLGVIALILLAGGAYFIQQQQTSAPSTQTQKEVMSEAAEFAKAMKSGRPTTCTMTKGDDVMEYHLKGKKMAANVTTSTEGKSTISHMINDEQYLYVWADDSKQGSKMSLTIPSPSPVNAPTSADQVPEFNSVDDYDQLQNDGYTINCQAGKFADSVFTPPTTVEFIDPSAMMRAIPSPNAAGEYDMSQLKELQKQYGGMTTAEDQ